MANSSFNFTKETIAKLLPPAKGRTVYKDTKEEALILMVYPTGRKAFYIAKNIKASDENYYRGKIGDFPNISVSEARITAADFRVRVDKEGFNPFVKEPEAPKELTFKELFDKYIDEYGKYNIKEWKYIVTSMNLRAQHLYDRKISAIQREDIQKIFYSITSTGQKVAANKFVVRMCAIFNKAIEWELTDKNPAARIKKHPEKARDRYILAEEKDRFFQAVQEETDPIMRDFILVALYTGARKSNVLSMRWENISFTNKTWYIADTKNGESQHVVLGDEAIKILIEMAKTARSEWVFPSDKSASGHLQEPKKAIARVRKRARMKDFRFHDLRRTKGSWMAMAGASEYVIAKALNHKNASLG